jgi:hypothetical protein
MSSPWCHGTVVRGAPKVSTNAAGPTTGKTYGPPARTGVALDGEPKPPTLGKGTVGSLFFAGGCRRALDCGGFALSRSSLFLLAGCGGRGLDGLVVTVAVGRGWASVTVGDVSVVVVVVGVVGGDGSSGVTASHEYARLSKTITVPSPRPVERAHVHPCPLASLQT